MIRSDPNKTQKLHKSHGSKLKSSSILPINQEGWLNDHD